MCGILGKTNMFSKSSYKEFKESLELINHRGIDEYGYYFDDYISFGHRRLVVIDKLNGKQPYIFNGLKMIYNGEIYNKEEIRNDLINKGYSFEGYSDTEVLIKCYNEYKEKCLEHLNGIFSFAIYDGKKLFIARDRLGVKPLYYAIYKKDLIFSSEMKSIINYTDYRDVDTYGLLRLLSIGPMSEVGKTVYKDIFELEKGCYLIFDGNISIKKYWSLEAKKLDLTYEETKEKVRLILDDAIKLQSVADVKVGAFLSGGLDSSIVYQVLKNHIRDIDSFCLDYEYNNQEFKKDEFNISRDQEYIKFLNPINHHDILISNYDLFENLKNALKARDYPGMADIDSSMYYLCKEIKKYNTVCLSGECADEIFGGYPWFFKDFDNFPWIRNIKIKEELLNEKLPLNQYVKDLYEKVIQDVSYLEDDDEKMRKKRLSMYLNINYFMQNMLERKDRMSMAHSLEVRVPFCDYRLVELMYNTKYEYMYNGVEKSLLREAYKDVLPKEIYNRKKSPYPKSHSLKYYNLIKDEVMKLFDSDSILNIIFKKSEIIKMLDGEFKPFYGQLMSAQSFLGFLYQFDYWYKEYKIRLKI